MSGLGSSAASGTNFSDPAVAKAAAAAIAAISTMNSTLVPPPGAIEDFIAVPDHQLGKLIGPKGGHINTLKATTGLLILEVLGNYKDPLGSPSGEPEWGCIPPNS